jgi:hypothetical protein
MTRLLTAAIVAALFPLVDPGSSPAAPPVALTGKAPNSWSLDPAKVDTRILADRDYKLTVVPREVNGAALLVRPAADHAHWLAPGMLTATKDCTVYAIIRTHYVGKKDVFGPQAIKQLEMDGWIAVDGEVGTTSPGNEKWEWAAWSKEVKKGDVDLTLKTLKWNARTAVLFVFK